MKTPKELDFPGTIARGAKGKKARLVQEWLCLNGHSVSVDNDYGPATQAAVSAFQAGAGINTSGRVTRATFDALTAPMHQALAPLANAPTDLNAAVVAVANQHLAVHPREVGGQNRGPWVRLYMDNNEGNAWPWCAGFVSLVIRQACAAVGRSLPFPKTYSCDVLASQGKERDLFVRGKDVDAATAVLALPPGTVFLNRRVANDWTHTGFVLEADRETFSTIEGNTNDEGSREGYEVCARTRGYAKKDFVRVDG